VVYFMRLQRLEINGFKSFSDRSELAFDAGVTAIVGPNGCGKSNVADAITWVMGEQSAKSLRGERMEDVIFNGSDARKPTAAAEVRLRFSGVLKSLTGPAFTDEGGNGHNGNGNGHHPPGPLDGVTPTILIPHELELIQSVAREVEVTRRLYRSGDSEYLIDGQLCRLRDVHDLLMDTGLGAKAYAIIEQGKIGLILSTRPTDRRQIIEEAAGVTRYKSRRRSAELKLEASRQNLTRVEDIVFEVEKQRGMLKRQAGKARRYQKLRDQLRQWEKVLFARKYRQLAETLASARGRLGDAREREATAAGRVAEIESGLGRLRIDLIEAESLAASSRQRAHARELAIIRQQQQIAFDREQIQAQNGRSAVVGTELETLHARSEPARLALAARREAARSAIADRDRAGMALVDDSEAYESAHREIEGLEADVEAARSEVFSAINSATALRHALEHAAAAREKVIETLTKLDVEIDDVRIESERVAADRAAAVDRLGRAQEAIEATRIARTARESELASARIEHEWRARSVRAREQELAGLEARLKSLEELEAARAGYGDAARALLVQANGKVGQQGAVADYLEVDAGFERAVEACLGDLLQHVVVDGPEHAAAGFQLVREQGAGRCGFVIASKAPSDVSGAVQASPEVPESYADGVVMLSSVVHVSGRFAGAIRSAIGDAWITDGYDRAAEASRVAPATVVTRAGDLFRGPHVVSGGERQEARGILETRREIRELRGRISGDRDALIRLGEETAGLESTMAQATAGIVALSAEHHRQEKAIVGYEAQLQHASDEATRLTQKGEQLVRERHQAEEERDGLDRRQVEAQESIGRLEHDQRSGDERLTMSQRRLFDARDAAEELNRRAAESGAAHAALVERATALEAEVRRLEESGAELDVRARVLADELDQIRRRVDDLGAAVVAGQSELDANERALQALQHEVGTADEVVSGLRVNADQLEASAKDARAALESIRTVVAELDIARVTAEGDLAHLSVSCLDAVQATLDQVVLDVEQMEQNAESMPIPASPATGVEEPDESDEDPGESVVAAEQRALSAEEAIATLRGKIDRLGPVNMMAIDQFDDLEARYAFLTTQRTDLVDSIAQTSEAIKRIDETTRQRFAEAFAAINRNFQQTFSTLFGGGRAGLTLLDETDPLESGIEIVAQPPGKRLQSVQLLSGGEKALTAIALMFGLFQYKPSPFCLLDEIDAPLDDANIGRFVEMLRSMQHHTQFILITHNRKTMEIADRLYGVTMEEPGVSKLISVRLN
jgi:chromosome segregation protein